jgi:hypothetical protein
MKNLFRLVLTALVLGISTAVSLADGCYIPPKAIRKIPEIPSQRAVICWKDGTETLVISSALNSEAQELGWIIPLPSVPDTLEKETPGGLKTLSFCLQPQIIHVSRHAVFAFGCIIIASLLMATALFHRGGFWSLFGLIFLLFLLAGLITPAASIAGRALGIRSARLTAELTVAVGSYEIAVLRPKLTSDLNAWLDKNGFASLPPAANDAVDDYIKAGWVFATIKLVRGETGTNTPHPIRMNFQSAEPVYPLRLTSLAGGHPEFELFIIGNQRATCNLLRTEYCDQFYRKDGNRWPQTYETKEVLAGKTNRNEIGHPAVCRLMWEGCVITKFSGTIEPERMVTDLKFTWIPFKAYRDIFYTRQGATESAIAIFIWITGGWLLVSMLIFRRQIAQPGNLWWYCNRVLLPVGLLAAVFASLFYASRSKLPDSEVRVMHGYLPSYDANAFKREIEMRIGDKPAILQKTEKEIAAYLQEHLGQYTRGVGSASLPSERRSRITGERFVAEDSPGNFTVEKTSSNAVIRAYDATGRSMVCELPEEETVNKPRR